VLKAGQVRVSAQRRYPGLADNFVAGRLRQREGERISGCSKAQRTASVTHVVLVDERNLDRAMVDVDGREPDEAVRELQTDGVAELDASFFAQPRAGGQRGERERLGDICGELREHGLFAE
jgi:hypothetical protein